MKASAARFEPELHISTRWVLGLLVIVSVGILIAGDGIADMGLRSQVTFLGVSLCLMAGVGWALDSWKQRIGQLVTTILLVALVLSVRFWLEIPGTLVFLSLVTGLAAVMIGLTAAAITTLGESLLVLLISHNLPLSVDRAELVIALVTAWGAMGVMLAAYRPLYQLEEWLSQYMDRAQKLLDDALDRKVELAQAMEDLSHANRQLALANERSASLRTVAEQAQESKASFVARVSHEFRTPLNMIIGLVGIMIEDPSIYEEELPPEIGEDLDIVYRNCQHLASMINDVLDLSQAEAGRLMLHRESADLKQIVQEAADVVRPMIAKKHLALHVSIADNLPPVNCDPTRIRQVVLNLISNAARFTTEGRIDVDVVQQESDVLVTVTDTGPGIPQEDIDRIFEPFYTARNDQMRDAKGSGLGLSISRQFIHLHGGRMGLKSEVGRGSSFHFALPVDQPSLTAAPYQRIREDWVWREQSFKTGHTYSREQLLRPRVLLFDETQELYPRLAHHSDDVEVLSVDGAAQIERALEDCPADVIMINTAREDDVLSRMRQLRIPDHSTPVIGCSIPRRVSRAQQLGAQRHLVKPVTRADLQQAIQSVGRPVRRILLVDDQPEVLQLWTRMLHIYDRSLEVTTVGDGQRALDLMARIHPDLVVLDVMMAGLDGWEVLAQMAKEDEICDIPVIVVSAQDPHAQLSLTPFLVASCGNGLSVARLLSCSLALSSILLNVAPEPEPTRP